MPKILVVEDNMPSSELLCDWLEVEGFQVLAVENLKQAFAFFEDQTPKAVLLDVKLGAEDGLSLARWIRQQSRLQHLPVFAVTAHALLTDHERVMQAGCNACISKPVDFKLLREHLNRWLPLSARLQAAPDGK
jgi:CheY-like chemotaxis protein